MLNLCLHFLLKLWVLPYSRPPEPLSPKAFSQSNHLSQWVSAGLEKATEWPESDSFCRESVTIADTLTTGIGTPQCRSFRRKFFTKFFPVCFEVAHEYLRISEERDHVQANRFLNQLDNHLRIHELNLTEGRERLKTFASKMASSCQRIVNQHDETDAIKLCSELFARYQLAAPNDTDVVGFFEKAACERFWFQKIKRKAAQTVEHVRRLCGVVNKKRGIYCSDDALRRWQIDKSLSAQFMEQTFLESSEGDHLSLAEIAAKNVSNPVIRRCEMMGL